MSGRQTIVAARDKARSNRRKLALATAVVGTVMLSVLVPRGTSDRAKSLPMLVADVAVERQPQPVSLPPTANTIPLTIKQRDITVPIVGERQRQVQHQAPIVVLVEKLRGAVIDMMADAQRPKMPMFNGRPIRPARTMWMTVTAYSPDEISCGDSADGITASGYSVWTNGMNMVAADTDVLPFGTLVSVPGYADGQAVPVLDRGGLIKGNRLDVLYPTDSIAREWGVRDLLVTVWEYADGKPADFREQHVVMAGE